jgi:hypothetical protein
MASFREVNHTFADLFRIRKVKCDEGKPHCKRCTSTGRICDGYDPTFRPPQSTTPSPPAKTRNSPQSRTGRILVRSQSPAYLAPALRFDTREERESFDFFTSHAVSSLRGFWTPHSGNEKYSRPPIKIPQFSTASLLWAQCIDVSTKARARI